MTRYQFFTVRPPFMKSVYYQKKFAVLQIGKFILTVDLRVIISGHLPRYRKDLLSYFNLKQFAVTELQAIFS